MMAWVVILNYQQPHRKCRAVGQNGISNSNNEVRLFFSRTKKYICAWLAACERVYYVVHSLYFCINQPHARRRCWKKSALFIWLGAQYKSCCFYPCCPEWLQLLFFLRDDAIVQTLRISLFTMYAPYFPQGIKTMQIRFSGHVKE